MTLGGAGAADAGTLTAARGAATSMLAMASLVIVQTSDDRDRVIDYSLPRARNRLIVPLIEAARELFIAT
jgi:hypothetical protein